MTALYDADILKSDSCVDMFNWYRCSNNCVKESLFPNMVISCNCDLLLWWVLLFYITMLGKGFPEHGYSETPVQIIISKTNIWFKHVSIARHNQIFLATIICYICIRKTSIAFPLTGSWNRDCLSITRQISCTNNLVRTILHHNPIHQTNISFSP